MGSVIPETVNHNFYHPERVFKTFISVVNPFFRKRDYVVIFHLVLGNFLFIVVWLSLTYIIRSISAFLGIMVFFSMFRLFLFTINNLF